MEVPEEARREHSLLIEFGARSPSHATGLNATGVGDVWEKHIFGGCVLSLSRGCVVGLDGILFFLIARRIHLVGFPSKSFA